MRAAAILTHPAISFCQASGTSRAGSYAEIGIKACPTRNYRVREKPPAVEILAGLG